MSKTKKNANSNSSSFLKPTLKEKLELLIQKEFYSSQKITTDEIIAFVRILFEDDNLQYYFLERVTDHHYSIEAIIPMTISLSSIEVIFDKPALSINYKYNQEEVAELLAILSEKADYIKLSLYEGQSNINRTIDEDIRFSNSNPNK